MTVSNYGTRAQEVQLDLPKLCRLPCDEQTRARRRKDLMLEDEIVVTGNILYRQYVSWANWVYVFLSIITCGTIAIVGAWPYFNQKKYLLLSRECKPLEADFVICENSDGSAFEICPIERIEELAMESRPYWDGSSKKQDPSSIPPEHRMFVYRHTRFVYRKETSTFEQLSSDEMPPMSLPSLYHGLSQYESTLRLKMIGRNSIEVPVPPVSILLLRECIHPFVIFQVWAVIVWLTEEYWTFSGFILATALLTAVMNLSHLLRNLRDIQELARDDSTAWVRRSYLSPSGKLEHKEEQVESSTLVPGDIVVIDEPGKVPADLVLIQGGASVTEAMLTGEVTIVSKTSVSLGRSDATSCQVAEKISRAEMRHTLFAGTTVVAPRPVKGQKVLAMVVRTGFETVKGRLILSILYPTPLPFKFMNQTLKFLALLFFLAMLGFIVNAIVVRQQGGGWGKIIQKGADMVTIVVPPALPLAITAGAMYALLALRKHHKISCISPNRINLAGKVNCILFDKTGTLTGDSLDLSGVLPSVASTNGHSEFKPETMSFHDLLPVFKLAFATCHSLALVDGQVAGDPLEEKMFAFSNGILQDGIEEPDGGEASLSSVSLDLSSNGGGTDQVDALILRTFDFSSTLQRMGVIVQVQGTGARLVGGPDSHFSFVKGSPEAIVSLCDPATVPVHLEENLKAYTSKGLRIIAAGYKEFPEPLPPSGDPAAMNGLRTRAESGLTFLGLIILENMLKPATIPTLVTLRNDANILMAMATGDNPVAAVAIARECHLAPAHHRVYMGDLVSTERMDEQAVVWRDVDNPSMELDSKTLLPHPPSTAEYSLAITGRALMHLYACVEQETIPLEYLQKMVIRCCVFARMSPEAKALAINIAAGTGLYVGMVGDGANDSMALKAAHVGLSLSPVEASVAAPFTSHVPDISAVIPLLCEGRGSLATAFSLFQFMALYSTIQFANALLSVLCDSFLSNNMYLYQDLWVVFILSLTFGSTRASPKLTRKRPSGRLFSPSNVLTVVVFIAITFITQAIAFMGVRRQSWYGDEDHPTRMDPDEPGSAGNHRIPETSSVFLIAAYQYISCATIFSGRGRPWKRSTWTNPILIFWMGVITFSAVILLIFQDTFRSIYDYIGLLPMPSAWRYTLLAIAVGGIGGYYIGIGLVDLSKYAGLLKKIDWDKKEKIHTRLRREWVETMNEINRSSASVSIDFSMHDKKYDMDTPMLPKELMNQDLAQLSSVSSEDQTNSMIPVPVIDLPNRAFDDPLTPIVMPYTPLAT